MTRLLLASVLLAGLGDTVMSWLEASDGLAGYGILLLAFLIGSVGAPLPEEAVLAMGGYLAAKGSMSLLGVYLFGYSVVLLIDCMLYVAGRRAGPALERSRLGRRIAPERFIAARAYFDRRGIWTVVAARFIMGIRIPVFLLSGALGVPARRFYPAVALSGLVSNAIPVLLGYYLADQITDVLAGIDAAHGWFLGGVLLTVAVVVVYLTVGAWRRRRDQRDVSRESSE